jgi:osmotically-inducible protein OsmY
MTMRMLTMAFVAVVLCSMQGCFPVVATGVGAGVVMAQDRRTPDAIVDDQKIEAKAGDLIDQQVTTPGHVNVTSFNYHVLVSGEVPDESTKEQVGKIVSGISGVRGVNNELAVAPATSIASRSKDTLVTSNVKMRFLDNKDFNSENVKVVTENGTVYLMGLVRRSEGDAAAEIASGTEGVKSVVRLFEYMD